jgi:hypothetical protein
LESDEDGRPGRRPTASIRSDQRERNNLLWNWRLRSSGTNARTVRAHASAHAAAAWAGTECSAHARGRLASS